MYMPYDQLPDPSGKFDLEEEIGSGFCAKVFKARDLQEDRYVAIKIQPYDEEHQRHIEEEYRLFRDYSSFPNIPNFYGAYRKRGSPDDIWLVMEYCEGGSAVELVNRLLKKDKKMNEEHIAFIIKEACKAIVELNRSHFIHRDVRGSNILLTKQGEVRLCDFGLTREVDSTIGKRGTCIGSPCWMAPELVTSQNTRGDEIYDSRIDVWALGITTIELGDGKPPFFDMHPSRALFQIVRNPPPTFFKPSNWSQNITDFISECLEKNPENRPMMMEIIEHPFLTENTENESQLQDEIRRFIEISKDVKYDKPEEISVERGYIKKLDSHPEKMYSEDLAGIENPMDDVILEHLQKRMGRGNCYAFIGDVLLSLNSNELQTEYSEDFHAKYKFKSRSENAPHIFTTADVAYQDMMHHKEPQHVIFSGESYSGKSTNVKLFIDHLCFLGGGNKGATDRVKNSLKAINLLCNAGTPLNNDSTRCCLQYHITFGTTGKMSGAVFLMYFLEKSRVSTTDMNQHNFHAIYCFYDYIINKKKAEDYFLDSSRNYRYMRIPSEQQAPVLNYCRDDPKGNVEKYQEFEKILNDLDMSNKNLETVRRILAAILHIGNIRFKQNEKGCEIEDKDVVTKVSELLRVDEKKFQWSLTQYIKVKGGIAERFQYTADEARCNRDAYSACLYSRLVDWIFNKINMNLSFPRAVFGDANCIIAYDMFGFECFPRNNMEQLMVNTLNEQMQYHYNQKIFTSEMYEQEADEIPAVKLNFYDNKQTLDHLLTKPDGLFYKIDDATRDNKDVESILESVADKRSNFIKTHGNSEINVSHCTGKINYDARGFLESNKDFLPPEIIESMRTSLDESIVLMFTNQLTKCGNLTMAFENVEHKKNDELRRTYVMNTLSQGQFSQGTVVRTLSSVFRSVCLDLLKTLSSGIQAGTHFVRCIRADLEFKPRNFHVEMVRQQLKALGVLDTVIGRQQGYSCRISFQEFLRRYQFLAFDFDENVDVTKDNCRLLLVRLKMEGWAIGKSKVFLRYYNDEFLSRLYETQVKKIIKVQSMMRAFLSRRRVAEKANPALAAERKLKRQSSKAEAATTIQKAYRGYKVRQKYGPLLNEHTGVIDRNTADFLKGFARKWKSKSLFQVLLHYRAARFQDFVNMSQQVHLYNQRVVANLHVCARSIALEKVDPRQSNISAFGPLPLAIRKIPFKLNDIPYFDTTYMCDPVNPLARIPIATNTDEEEWDAPFQKNPSLTAYLMTYNAFKKEQSCQTNWDKMYESDNIYNQSYLRDPNKMKNRNTDSQSSNYYNENNEQNNYGSQTQSYYQNRGNTMSYNSGSRRNSLKNHRAPAPPSINVMKNTEASAWVRGNDNSWRKPSDSYNQRRDFKPPNPVKELEMLGRKANMDNDDDAPPFNFRSMLRKTKHENNNYEYNSRDNEGSGNNGFLQPKLRSTGMSRYDNNNDDSSYRKTSIASTSDGSYSRTYIEEEIAPGVTLSGYAIDI